MPNAKLRFIIRHAEGRDFAILDTSKPSPHDWLVKLPKEFAERVRDALNEAVVHPEIETLFVLYSRKHSRPGHPFTFWKANRCGYTQDLASAGRYTAAEAAEIMGNGETSIAIAEEDLARLSPRLIIDPEWSNNQTEIDSLTREAIDRLIGTK